MSKFDSKHSRKRRPIGETKEVKKTFLIYCEGQTEEEYFLHLKTKKRLSNINIVLVQLSEQGNAITLVEDALKRKKESKDEYDEYWIVFDKDDTPNEKFQEAIDKCINGNIQTAYSIQAFEIWLILHFMKIHTHLDRKDYTQKLNQYLKNEYGKSKDELRKVFDEISDKTSEAIINAQKGFDFFEKEKTPIPQRESITCIFQLVQKIMNT